MWAVSQILVVVFDELIMTLFYNMCIIIFFSKHLFLICNYYMSCLVHFVLQTRTATCQIGRSHVLAKNPFFFFKVVSIDLFWCKSNLFGTLFLRNLFVILKKKIRTSFSIFFSSKLLPTKTVKENDGFVWNRRRQ